jgi:hypothetical protein
LIGCINDFINCEWFWANFLVLTILANIHGQHSMDNVCFLQMVLLSLCAVKCLLMSKLVLPLYFNCYSLNQIEPMRYFLENLYLSFLMSFNNVIFTSAQRWCENCFGEFILKFHYVMKWCYFHFCPMVMWKYLLRWVQC